MRVSYALRGPNRLHINLSVQALNDETMNGSKHLKRNLGPVTQFAIKQALGAVMSILVCI
ncbi:hypothetical protein [Pseudoalteromonas luteoviolacea]|uniref:hypothetical protein n=1 Tax=Pseudoalteromonas luteoviolacea TaxID=43657 RepID=UPI00114D63CC|nr:hypothetical protein [Pseudoalteromonas luteoviolacea]TQF66647.1 hypothetical protein FLM44_23970 [Pseudoalteromonas luteoviolacea]